MRPARLILMVTTVAAVALAGALSAQQAKPAKPMQIEKVKDLGAERMRRRLRRRWHAARGGRRGRPRHTGRIKYLLNTHHHTDHAGGDAVFINTTEIIAHRNVRENFLRNKQPGAPRVTFNDQASVFLGNVEVRAYYFGRGHTNGDAVIYFPDVPLDQVFTQLKLPTWDGTTRSAPRHSKAA